MGEDLSNKTLAILLAVSVVISLGGLIVFLTSGGEQLTGAAISPTAIARINITARASINWTVYTIDWGTGFVNETAQYCLLNSEGENNAANCSNFTTVTQGLRLENDGNRRVSVNLSSNVTPAEFIGGTDPWFQWKINNSETDACGDVGPGITCTPNASLPNFYDAYYTVSTAAIEICPCFFFGNDNDTMDVNLQVKVPSDSYTGEREATLTAIATVI
ncbi:hypothetical protein JW898_01415 [Candidatus Woesearchaeota archaeon]|nr:hypothetical protein [Candidatus Woesearchaeota archaeon]